MKTIFVYNKLQLQPEKYKKYGNITSPYHCIVILFTASKQQYSSSSNLQRNTSSRKGD
jgi:hypothetical protein